MQPKISVIGVGYVGLCTALGLASRGYSVIATDIDAEKINKINQGFPPFFEPGLEEKLSRCIQKGTLTGLVNQTDRAILSTDFTYVAVGTPSKPDGSIDLTYIKSAVAAIGKALKQKSSYHLIIIKSTVVPGTTQNVLLPLLELESAKKCSVDFGLCVNPEFLRQGSAFHDTLHVDRIIIGSPDQQTSRRLEVLYQDIYSPQVPPILQTSLATAELIKYASNAMLATKISFINTIANICEKIPGADVTVVAQAMGLDKRIGSQFLDAGLGYGGSCFPKDLKALLACSKALGYTPELLDATEKVNQKQPLRAIELCRQQLGTLSGKQIAILGLAFKPHTDDLREAQAIPLINQLLAEGACVAAYDPVALPLAKNIFKDSIYYASSAVDCLRNADCCILVTEWPEFKTLTPDFFKTNMKQPLLIDGRRIYNPQKFSKTLQFSAIGLGQ
ncbi:MAG: UDP-glucose/GDP-mannose dehydrogenase family protein [Nitrososphaerota archaeon]|jgi:UDPglucose 6-dehydrogenase|nr:UDP-glucose/GDP-mannose dehydrogenase family protein [Nitrososphaerota archaeon]